ncbi:MAG: transglutaminase-like domain-containing protein, partial [Candidatus Omnitrophica bacterium]|nr:transglutaminase-like domain-containing protein [Candidatus Omnitrophota bacterium]
KASDAIKDKVNQLIHGLKSDEEKARAIYNFCAREIRYVAVEYGQAGYEPHRAEEIFLNKYGDCKDQAILLVTMLREAGFEAYPVLIGTKDYYDLNEDLPSMRFNHAIATVKINDAYIFLDPTAETCSFGDLPASDQARKVLVFQDNSFKILQTPLSKAEDNLVREELVIRANSDGSIKAKKKVFTFGYYDQGRRYWLLYTPPKLIEEAIKEKIQEVSIGAQLEDYNLSDVADLDKPTVLEYAFKGSDYFIIAADIYILPLLGKINTALVSKESRRYPIEFDVLDKFEKTIEIKIPPNFKLRFMPQSFEKESRWIKIKIEYRFEKDTLYYKETKTLKQIIIPTSEYQDYKKFIEEVAKLSKQQIVLEKIR